MIKYIQFLKDFDSKLKKYFNQHQEFIHCKLYCSECCEKGDYPISELELNYMMQGYIELDNETKIIIQENIQKIKKGGACPFLINKKCSLYNYRPIICRVHGLAYLYKNNTVKLPYCVNSNKNYVNVYANCEINIEPIKENLDTQEVLKNFNFGEIRNLYDWLNH